MARKYVDVPDPRETERATHVQVALYPGDAAAFDAMLAVSGLTKSGWLRGAIRVAAADPEVAQAITKSADNVGHGGWRPGAGRPPREESV